MKIAIYARYSTEKQDARSIDDQERRCRATAAEKGLVAIEVYSDQAISGGHLRRDGLQRMLADAKARKFKAVIVDDLYRLSRDRVDSGVLLRDLKDLRVTVFDVETGLSSNDEAADMVFGVKALIGGEYIKAISRQTHRGLEGRALAGFNPGGKAYGYTSVEEPNPTDPTRPRRLTIIDPQEAAVVRRIFAETVAGKSPRDVAYALNADGIPAPHDGGKGHKGARGWGHTTIRSMLINRRYVGEAVWNQYKWTKTARGTRQRDLRPEKDWIRQVRPELAIIDVETFETVGKNHSRRGTRETPVVRARHLLSGLLTCGVCGGTFGVVHSRKVGGTVYRTLGCVSHRDRGGAICTNSKTISDRKVIKALGSHLRERLSRPDRVKRFIDAFQAQYAALEAKGEDPTAILQTKIERAKQSVEAAMSALLAVPGSVALAAKLAAEERALQALREQIENLQPKRPSILLHPAAVAAYVGKLVDVLVHLAPWWGEIG